MARLEAICRVLRDVGIFLLGVAAITVAVDYVFIHPDPTRDMQRAMIRSFTEAMEERVKQPDASRHGDSGSETPPVQTRSGQ
jgi:hypothetical protein